jgi:hypothetical protein
VYVLNELKGQILKYSMQKLKTVINDFKRLLLTGEDGGLDRFSTFDKGGVLESLKPEQSAPNVSSRSCR